MNVGELKKLLDAYPDNMVFTVGKYSDHAIVVEPGDFSVVQGVEKDGWVMASHSTMSAENKANEKSYLYLVGN